MKGFGNAGQVHEQELLRKREQLLEQCEPRERAARVRQEGFVGLEPHRRDARRREDDRRPGRLVGIANDDARATIKKQLVQRVGDGSVPGQVEA